MLLRRVAPAALAISALSACEPGVGYDPARNGQTNYAVFDPSTSQIPLPNDLALQQAGTLGGAQGELLRLFVAAGGFPNDQEVPITIDLVQIGPDPTGATVVRTKPALDLSSISLCTAAGQNCNLAVMDLGAQAFIAIDQPVAADYVTNGDHGTLTLHRVLHDIPSGTGTIKSRVWDAGVHYVAAIRGGPNGVTVNNGQKILPQPAMYIIEQGLDLTKPENQALIPGNSAAEKAANAAQLDQVRRLYEAGPFPILSAVFPKPEIATLTTFQIAPRGTTAPSAQPVVDASAGVVPLPSNLLLDGATLPDDPLAPAINARVQNIPTFGPLAPGLASLDGFTTTALLLVPTSAPVVVATGSGPTSTFTNNVFLYDLTDPNNPALVDPATYDDLLTSAARQETAPGSGVWVSAVIGVQPAAATKPTTTKPLKEATDYAFVVTKRIIGALDQRPLGRPTVASIVLFDNAVWAGGKSQLAGVSDAQAKGLERMRAQIAKVLPKLQALPSPQTTTKADIAIAYTFRTQTITTPALQLAAAPYADATRSKDINVLSMTTYGVCADPLAPTCAGNDTGAVFTKYGVDQGVVPRTNIGEIIEAIIPTSNLLDPTTGAFNPAFFAPGATPPTELLNVLIVVPRDVQLIHCPGSTTVNCAPLVVFHHGLNGGRAQMLLGADALAAKGFVVAAIDAPKHGDRGFCLANGDCAGGTSPTCTPIGPPGIQGDATPLGTCTNGSKLLKKPVLCTTAPCVANATDGVPAFPSTGGNAPGVVSLNLFRTRDTFRQDVLDNSSLILALSRPLTLPATTNPNPVAAELLGAGRSLVLDGRVFWEGQSLGSILGTMNVAANPRISEAVLNVGGGTFVDIGVSSPAFQPLVDGLLASQTPPILPKTPAYLQFVQVAKWALDPFDPINFAGRVLGDATHPTLPNLLASPPAAQAGKSVIGQIATCDAVVPNPFNALLYNVMGLATPSTTPSGLTVFVNSTQTSGTCPVVGGTPPGTVAHGFLLDYGLSFPGNGPAHQLTLDAQGQAANFLFDPVNNIPPPQVVR